MSATVWVVKTSKDNKKKTLEKSGVFFECCITK